MIFDSIKDKTIVGFPFKLYDRRGQEIDVACHYVDTDTGECRFHVKDKVGDYVFARQYEEIAVATFFADAPLKVVDCNGIDATNPYRQGKPLEDIQDQTVCGKRVQEVVEKMHLSAYTHGRMILNAPSPELLDDLRKGALERDKIWKAIGVDLAQPVAERTVKTLLKDEKMCYPGECVIYTDPIGRENDSGGNYTIPHAFRCALIPALDSLVADASKACDEMLYCDEPTIIQPKES